MLVDEDWVAVWISDDEACGAGGGFVGRFAGRDAAGFELFLEVAHVFVVGQGGGVSVPAWVVGEHVLREHALEEADGAGLVLEDEPVFGLVAADDVEAELFVEGAGDGDVFDG